MNYEIPEGPFSKNIRTSDPLGSEIKIGAATLTLRYDWAALDRLQKEIGEKLLAVMFQDRNHRAIAQTVAIGLQLYHPTWSEEQVYTAAPPVGPTMAAVDAALSLAIHGPKAPDRKKVGPWTMFSRHGKEA